MPTQVQELGQFEFPAKKKIGISATPRIMAGPPSSQIGLRLSADPVGVRNDPHQDPHAQAVAQEKT